MGRIKKKNTMHYDWSYEYSDYVSDEKEPIAFDSFLVAEEDLEIGEQRNLTVDNYLTLPVNTSIRMLVSSNDVIHCFAVPSLGIKADGYPGRLNSIGFIINREGVFYGQCSEICGAMHGYMPIGVKSVSLPSFLSFVNSF